jgi:hypothetical protein
MKYVVGLPDTQGGMAWLAGYQSDPTRYYSPELALRFTDQAQAEKAIKRAKKAHPSKERRYIIMAEHEMEDFNQ